MYPVIVFCHGGAFRNGNKGDESLEPVLRGLDRGYAVVSVGYRKSGESRFPAMLYDAKAALRFLRANAGSYQLDKDKIAAWGPSSGGWLVSMLGTTMGNPAFEDRSMGNTEFSSSVQTVIDWCGPCGNFLAMDEALQKSGLGAGDHGEADSPESMFLGVQISKVPELVRLASKPHHGPNWFHEKWVSDGCLDFLDKVLER